MPFTGRTGRNLIHSIHPGGKKGVIYLFVTLHLDF